MLALAICLLATGVSSPLSADQIVPHLYQRTTYLEGLLSPLAWWANPALALDSDQPLLLTVNCSPIGDRYTVSSVRFALPLHRQLAVGLGIAGAGPVQTGSFQVSNSGATYQSNFIFSRPSFQAAFAGSLPYIGTGGAMLMGGIEQVPVGAEQMESYGLLGIGIGWLTPSLWGIQGSFAALWVGHFQYKTYWDGDMKLGLRASLPEELLRFSLEYARPLPESLRRPDPSSSAPYEVLKTVMTMRAGSILDVSTGLSTDFHTYEGHNGLCLHFGAALRRTAINSLLGGYEIGVSMDGSWHILHRFWIGYLLGTRTEVQ